MSLFLLLKKLLNNKGQAVLVCGCILAASCLLPSCAKQVHVRGEIVEKTLLPSELVKRINVYKKIKSLKAVASTELRYKRFNKKLDLALAVLPPGQAQLDFFDNVAGSIIQMELSPDRLEFYGFGKEVVYKGPDIRKMLTRLTGLIWGPEDLVRVFLGTLPCEIDPRALFPKDTSGNYWIEEGSVAVNFINGEVEYIKFEKNKPVARIKYGNYEDSGVGLFPRSISIEVPRSRLSLRIFYKDLEWKK